MDLDDFANRIELILRERDKALRTLDMDFARRLMPEASNDHVRLIAMHKARYELKGMAPELREASREWLEAHGYRRFAGLHWEQTGH